MLLRMGGPGDSWHTPGDFSWLLGQGLWYPLKPSGGPGWPSPVPLRRGRVTAAPPEVPHPAGTRWPCLSWGSMGSSSCCLWPSTSATSTGPDGATSAACCPVPAACPVGPRGDTRPASALPTVAPEGRAPARAAEGRPRAGPGCAQGGLHPVGRGFTLIPGCSTGGMGGTLDLRG